MQIPMEQPHRVHGHERTPFLNLKSLSYTLSNSRTACKPTFWETKSLFSFNTPWKRRTACKPQYPEPKILSLHLSGTLHVKPIFPEYK